MPIKRKRKQSNPDQNLDHQRLTSLINSMADAVIAVDPHSRVMLFNAAALSILDVNTIRIGSHLETLLKPINKNNQTVDIVKMIVSAKVPVTSRDLRLKYTDGSLINLYLSIAPVRLGYGKSGQQGFVLLLRDITREKSLEEERDEFISVVSHELRTPIAIAEGNIGNAEFLSQKSGDLQAIRQALSEAHHQVLFLADMINDLSTLSRAERGKLEVEIESIDVKGLVAELAKNYEPQAAAKGLKLTHKLDSGLGNLNSSRLYVREILQNFITNAVKYTAKGSIAIEAQTLPDGVCFLVKDTGIGISKGDQEHVFDKFFRSEDFRTRQANGTGLGLYVTMKLASLIHAQIELESELDKGSVFKISIPNLK